MPVYQTVLVFVGIPGALLGFFAACVFGPDLLRRQRYRSGEPWPFEPVWFCPNPTALAPETRDLLALDVADRPAVGSRPRAALTAGGESSAGGSTAVPASARTARGGAHGDW